MLRQFRSKSVYVKIYTNRFVLKLLEDGQVPVTVMPPEPFTTKRLLVGNFTAAEVALKTGLKQVFAGRWFSSSPAVVMQPMDMIEGGLSQVEERLFMESAAGAGARNVVVWVGNELSDDEARRALGR